MTSHDIRPTPLDQLFGWCEMLVLVIVLFMGTSAAWAGVIICERYAEGHGYESALFWTVAMVMVWCLAAAPIFYVQLAVIVDAIGTRMLGRPSLLHQLVTFDRPSGGAALIWPMVIVWGIFSPVSALAAIAHYALAPIPRPLAACRLRTWAAVNAMAAASDRLRRRDNDTLK
jgi:hypothetical protein